MLTVTLMPQSTRRLSTGQQYYGKLVWQDGGMPQQACQAGAGLSHFHYKQTGQTTPVWPPPSTAKCAALQPAPSDSEEGGLKLLPCLHSCPLETLCCIAHWFGQTVTSHHHHLLLQHNKLHTADAPLIHATMQQFHLRVKKRARDIGV
jgi:hypothetical protein